MSTGNPGEPQHDIYHFDDDPQTIEQIEGVNVAFYVGQLSLAESCTNEIAGAEQLLATAKLDNNPEDISRLERHIMYLKSTKILAEEVTRNSHYGGGSYE